MKQEINLLPQGVQRQRARRIYLRAIGRFLRRVYLALAVVVAVLSLTYLAVLFIRRSVVEGVDLVPGSRDLAARVGQVNQLLVEFERRLDGFTVWSLLIEDVLAVVPEGVRLTSLEAPADEEALHLEGVAAKRADVVDLQRSLEGLPWVESVEAPLQNFALGPTNEFSFSVHLRKGS